MDGLDQYDTACDAKLGERAENTDHKEQRNYRRYFIVALQVSGQTRPSSEHQKYQNMMWARFIDPWSIFRGIGGNPVKCCVCH